MIQPNRFLRVVSFVFSRAQPFPFISTNSREQNNAAVLWHLQNFSVLMNISYFCPVDMDWQSKTTRNLNMSIFNARKYMPRFRYFLLMATKYEQYSFGGLVRRILCVSEFAIWKYIRASTGGWYNWDLRLEPLEMTINRRSAGLFRARKNKF